MKDETSLLTQSPIMLTITRKSIFRSSSDRPHMLRCEKCDEMLRDTALFQITIEDDVSGTVALLCLSCLTGHVVEIYEMFPYDFPIH